MFNLKDGEFHQDYYFYFVNTMSWDWIKDLYLWDKFGLFILIKKLVVYDKKLLDDFENWVMKE